MYNIVKSAFVYGEDFKDIEELEIKWFDYVNWYNNIRIHGSLVYVTPEEYERNENKVKSNGQCCSDKNCPKKYCLIKKIDPVKKVYFSLLLSLHNNI